VASVGKRLSVEESALLDRLARNEQLWKRLREKLKSGTSFAEFCGRLIGGIFDYYARKDGFSDPPLSKRVKWCRSLKKKANGLSADLEHAQLNGIFHCPNSGGGVFWPFPDTSLRLPEKLRQQVGKGYPYGLTESQFQAQLQSQLTIFAAWLNAYIDQYSEIRTLRKKDNYENNKTNQDHLTDHLINFFKIHFRNVSAADLTDLVMAVYGYKAANRPAVYGAMIKAIKRRRHKPVVPELRVSAERMREVEAEIRKSKKMRIKRPWTTSR
jgi:hypothetical protein